MSGPDLRNARLTLQLSAHAFGRAVGLRGQHCHLSVYRWEGSRQPVPASVAAKVLSWLTADDRPLPSPYYRKRRRIHYLKGAL